MDILFCLDEQIYYAALLKQNTMKFVLKAKWLFKSSIWSQANLVFSFFKKPKLFL